MHTRTRVPISVSLFAFLLLALGCGSTPQPIGPKPAKATRAKQEAPPPCTALVIAHRGASGHLPEHTLEAYTAAYFMGADMIEPDLVATRDGHLVCVHDLNLEEVTDVAAVFPDRSREDGHWYAIDFDLSEIKTLTVTGRDGEWAGTQVPTFAEMLALIRRLNAATGRSVGVIPELKQPEFHAEEGADLVESVLATLEQEGWDDDRIILQCFHAPTLKRLREDVRCRARLLYLTSETITSEHIAKVRPYVDAIGPSRKVIDEDPTLIKRAKTFGLLVIPYTFKDEPKPMNQYMREYGVDGLFTDFPLTAVEVRELPGMGR